MTSGGPSLPRKADPAPSSEGGPSPLREQASRRCLWPRAATTPGYIYLVVTSQRRQGISRFGALTRARNRGPLHIRIPFSVLSSSARFSSASASSGNKRLWTIQWSSGHLFEPASAPGTAGIYMQSLCCLSRFDAITTTRSAAHGPCKAHSELVSFYHKEFFCAVTARPWS